MTPEPLLETTIDRKVPAVMRDGTTLFSDVYRPKKPGRYPVIVERVAYELDSRLEPYADFYASRGYVFVGQNTRGTFWSQGEFSGVKDDGWGENRDGYDTIEWAASQSWSDGNVGTMDGSWSGMTQTLMAPTRPPHLRTMFLRMAPAGMLESGGGVDSIGMRIFLARHTLIRAKHESASDRLRSFIPELEELLADPTAALELLPSAERPVLKTLYPGLGNILGGKPNHPSRLDLDATKQTAEVDVPALHLGGWFDSFLPETIAMYSGVRNQGFSGRARRNQRMLIGPWVHGPMEPNNPSQGDLDFGPESVLGINEFRLNWFDFWMKGVSKGVPDLPQVRLFVMGENRWRDFDSWPPEGAAETKLFLRNPEADGRGRLSFDTPVEDEGSTSYVYDPFDPVPVYRGEHQGFQANGPIDLAPSEDRKITFTSKPLQRPLTVIGPIKAKLWAKSSAKDTDWFVTLTDVWPDGRSLRVQEGSLRARYREGFDREVLMKPGKPYIFDIDLKATALRVESGHRLRLAITSSQFPPAERNMNTGGDNELETNGIVAHNTVLHDHNHPSHVVLPVFG